MGDEAGETRDLEEMNGVGGGDDDGRHVLEWEEGLPDGVDVTPLSFQLVPQGLLTAFSITPEPMRSELDVNRASQNTLSNLRRHSSAAAAAAAGKPFSSFSTGAVEDPMVVDNSDGGKPSRKVLRRLDSDDADSLAATEIEDQSAATAKRQRLVWTPQLHKRFVDVVSHIGIKNAVPKTIMQLMNVEGLTRENVASHLQKYRLYLKRMQGLPGDGGGPAASSSDHLFASTPVPQSLHKQQPPATAVPMHHMPYAMPAMIPVPMFGMPVNTPPNGGPYQSNWPGSISYPQHHATPSDK